MSDNPTFTRAANLDVTDAGEVVGMVAPWDQVADVADTEDDGTVHRYREVFRRGAFTRMITGLRERGWTAAIALNIDHLDGFSNHIGYATAIEERDDGAWGTFALYESSDIAKVKSMLRTSHRGMSVGFVGLRSRTVDGIVERLVAHIEHVAVTPIAAYTGAGVTSVRTLDIYESQVLETPHLDALRADLEAMRR